MSREELIRRGTMQARRNTLITKPKAAIDAGEGISIEDVNGTILIFIFGGPGSGKGTVVNNLVDLFNFRFVCGEDLIMENLSKALLPDGGSGLGTTATRELQKLVMEDSSQVTLHWVLELIDTEISKYPGEVVIVDMVPNLKFLLRVPELSKECTKEMKAFETKHPIAFAIDLALDRDHLLQNINQTHACTKAPGQNKQQSGGEDKNSSDEMDTSRTQRRFNIYLSSVKEFLMYFSSKNKLLVVDTSCGDVEAVWDSVSEYVVDAKISSPKGGNEQVVLFKFKEDDFSDIDRDRYPMKDLELKNLGVNVNSSPDEIMKKLGVCLHENVHLWKTFILDVSGSRLCSSSEMDKVSNAPLMFVDTDFGQLDYYIHGLKRKTERRKSFIRKQDQIYKTLVTSENDIFIFPKSTEVTLCQQISLCFKKNAFKVCS